MTRRARQTGWLKRTAAALGLARASGNLPDDAAPVVSDDAWKAAERPQTSPLERPADNVPAAPITRRWRRAGAEEVARAVALGFLDEQLAGYPLLSDDIDAAGRAWCETHKLNPPPASLVREAFAALACVRRSRPRLRQDDAAHRAIAARLRRLGRPDGRATVFMVTSGPALLSLNPSAALVKSRNARCGHAALPLGASPERRAESALGALGARVGARTSTGRAAA